MASYITPHPKTGWRYQRHVPLDVRALLGGRKVSVKYIPAMAKRDAEKHARSYAVKDDELWSKLRQLPATEVAKLAANGGFDRLCMSIPDMAKNIQLADRVHAWAKTVDPRKAAQIGNDPKWDEQRMALWLHDLTNPTERELAIRAEHESVQSIVRKIAPENSEHSLDGLFQLWIKVREPKTTRKYAARIRHLKTVIGDIDYRDATQSHIAKYRDYVATIGVSKSSQIDYISQVKTLFSAAVSDNKIPVNPAAGVNVFGKRPSTKASEDRPFTGAEIRLILEKAAEIKFGRKRHTEVLWMLRLLAWTGARPNEIAQLRENDVAIESGVPLIHIRAVHSLQSVKTEDARKVPLHNAVAEFVAYAEGSNTDFLFASFPHDKNNGRAAWLIAHFGGFLRQTCGIMGAKKTLYSFRHRFVDSTRNAALSEELSKTLTGHSTGDVHGKYGKGPGLRVLAEAIAKIDPLAD